MQVTILEERKEIYDYITNFHDSFNYFVSLDNNDRFARFVPFLELLDFRLRTGIINEFSISRFSGMPTFIELCQLISDNHNADNEISRRFTVDELRDELISEIESNSTFFPESLANYLERISKRAYFDSVRNYNLSNGISVDSRLLEKGQTSDLVGLNVSGYHLPTSTFIIYDIDLLINKSGIFRKNKRADENIDEKLITKLKNSFGDESNLIFYNLSQDSNLSPRRIRRTIVGPFYFKGVTPNIILSKFDPFNDQISNVEYVLSFHEDESTPDLSIGYSNTKEAAQNPFLRINHFYLAHNSSLDNIRAVIPEEFILQIDKND